MKKIININLSGRVIPIEDTAYEKLQAYIESLRRHFANEEGKDEIINDIESRIAELMDDKIRKGASCITDDDVEMIARSMGRPEDLAADEAAFAEEGPSSSQQQNTNAGEQSGHRRKTGLYRDANDKMIGGVCAGIANHLNIDPSIVRIIFAIITFGGFGFGFLIYILLWIILPTKEITQYRGKRLYRNPEDRVLGGVASGIAAYLNKETWVIRLVFAGPLLLNILLNVLSWPFFHIEGAIFPNVVFGSLASTFVLTYIILWIVLPEARSDYQQMEMRGEKVDVNAIKQNVQDRAKEFGQEVKAAAENFSNRAKEFSSTRGREFASEVGTAARRTGSGLGHAIGVIFKVFFLIIAGSIAMALFAALMAIVFGGVGIWPITGFFLDGFWQKAFAWGTLIFFLGIPLIAFLTWLIRRIMRVRSRGGYLGWTFGGLWTLGWVCLVMFIASITQDFRYYERVEENPTISQPANGKMIIKITEPEIRYTGSWSWIHFDRSSGFDVTPDSMKIANVKIRVTKSEDSNYHVKVYRYSAGESSAEAVARAEKVKFNSSYSDSVLNLGSGLAIDKRSKFRGQGVIVEVFVPAGKKIRFDEGMDDLYHPFSVRIGDNKRGWKRWRDHGNAEWEFENWFDYETGVDYTMTADGKLIDPKNPEKEKNDNGDYRYDDDKKQREKELREELRQIEEDKEADKKKLQQELKQLEETNRKDSINKIKTGTTEIITKEEINNSTGMISPVMSVSSLLTY